MTVDSSGYFYLIGETTAGKLPTKLGAVQPRDTSDYLSGIAVDSSGNIYAVGYTNWW